MSIFTHNRPERALIPLAAELARAYAITSPLHRISRIRSAWSRLSPNHNLRWLTWRRINWSKDNVFPVKKRLIAAAIVARSARNGTRDTWATCKWQHVPSPSSSSSIRRQLDRVDPWWIGSFAWEVCLNCEEFQFWDELLTLEFRVMKLRN